jgi:hypothetical protein
VLGVFAKVARLAGKLDIRRPVRATSGKGNDVIDVIGVSKATTAIGATTLLRVVNLPYVIG